MTPILAYVISNAVATGVVCALLLGAVVMLMNITKLKHGQTPLWRIGGRCRYLCRDILGASGALIF